MARTFRVRPSELLGIADGWEAFEVDEAVMLAGDHLEGIVARAEAEAIKGKRDPGEAASRALRRALGVELAAPRRPRGRPRFRYNLADPNGLTVTRVEE